MVARLERCLAAQPPDTVAAEQLLCSVVQTHIARTLAGYGDEAAARVEPDTNVLDAGADSLLLVALRQTLCTQLGIDLPMAALAQQPTPRHIAEVAVSLCVQRGPTITAATTASPAVRPSPVLPAGATAPPKSAYRPHATASLPLVLGIGTALPRFSDAQDHMAENFLQSTLRWVLCLVDTNI